MRMGVDIGGTKIEIAVLEPAGEISWRKRIAAPAGSYRKTLETIRNLVDAADSRIGRRVPVGVGIPGSVSPATGLVKNANSTWLIGKPFDRDLAAMLGRPVRLANDANCFALSEAKDGAGADQPVVFGAILGTGVGGGIVVNGRLLTGPHVIAGEWGHNPLPWAQPDERARASDGPPCYCGKRDCIETYLSGAGLAGAYQREAGVGEDAKRIATRAISGEAEAVAVMERYFDRLARALASVINVLDPDIIVLGGGLSNIDAIYSEVPTRLGAYVFSDSCTTPVVKNVHGDSSGVRGAAWLWPEAE